MANTHTGTDWKTETKITTDIMKSIDEGVQSNTDLIDSLDIVSSNGTRIPNNSDLNDYTTPGKYYINDSSGASTLSNTPITNAGFSLYVLSLIGNGSMTQIILANSYTQPMFIRIYRASGTTWSSWFQVTTTAT